MAKARIVYEVDDKALDALKKKLQELRDAGHDVPEGFDDLTPKIKESGGALTDLKGKLTGLLSVGAAAVLIKEFANLTQEVNKNRKEVALLTNETGKALDNITAKVRATAGTFGKDFNEVLRAANTLSKEFGTSLSESIDNVNEGFLRGLDVNGEYLQTLSEYSTFIKEAGLNQQQFNVLIQKQVTQGIYSDKGIDAIKEAVISIREMTPATRDAIKAIGINTDELIRDITSGTKTYFEAVQEIAQRTQELADPTKTGTILADVFRGAGEDAGKFIFTLGDVQKGYIAASEEQQRYIDKQRALLNTSEDLNRELVSFSTNFAGATVGLKTLTNQIATGTLSALNTMLGVFVSLESATTDFKTAIQGLEIAELNRELAELEKGPSFGEKLFGIAAPGVAAAQAEKRNAQILAIKDRINELTNAEEEEADVIEKKVIPAIQKETKARTDLAEVKDPDLDSETDRFIKEFETKKDRESEFTDWLAEENKKRAENAQDYRAEDLQQESNHQERKRELISAGVDGFLDILNGFNQLRIQQIDQELQANEMARNRELELAEGNVERQKAINKKYDEERSKLRTKQVQAQKQQSIFEAVVNTARAVAEALPNIPLSILAGAIGAAQIAFIAAQPIPKFAKGVIGLQGPGTETSDSIPALLSRGESVMTARETKDYNETLKAIRRREIRPEVLNKFILEGGRQPIVLDNYDKLAEAVINQPKFNMNMDEDGFSIFMQNRMSRMSIKQSKYKM